MADRQTIALVDCGVFPWAEADADRLHARLGQFVYTTDRVRAVAQRCGLPVEAAPGGSASALMMWRWALSDAATRGLGRKLMEAVIADPSLAAGRAEIEALFLAEVTPPEPAPEATEGPRPSQLPEGMGPYRGLAPFEAEHAPIFFGRDAEIAALVQRLEQGARLITVVAASGSGKSSLIRAGVVPAVRGGAFAGPWVTAMMKPGARACEALALALLKALPAARDGRSLNRASVELTEEIRSAVETPAFAASLRRTVVAGLPDDAAGLLLVVDQFEELFTLSRDDAERDAFVANLLEVIDPTDAPVRVILTMRADFTGHFLRQETLGARFDDTVFGLGPMSAAHLREVVGAPATLAGYRFEPGLVEELVSEAVGEPGHLPLLAFALQQLWGRRDQATGLLRWQAYLEFGGLRGAINAHAEAVFARMPPARQAVTRDVFGHLVRPGQGAEDTRQRAERSDVETLGPEAATVIDALVDARLLTTRHDAEAARDEVEVAHEALIREWARLRGWIDAEREGLVLRQRIGQAAGQWEADRRADADLWRGANLQRAVELRDDGRPPLTAGQRAFVDASEAGAKAQAEAVEQRRRRTIAALVAGVVLAVGAALGGFALWRGAESAWAETDDALQREATQRRQADVERDRAKEAEVRAHDAVRLSVAQQLRETRPTSAALVLAEVEHPERSTPTVQLLIDLAAQPGLVRSVLEGHEGRVQSATFSPDGKHVVTASRDKTARVWNADGTGTPVVLQGHGAQVRSAVFSPDGERVVTASADKTARVWNADGTGTPVVLQGHSGELFSAAFSPDGKRVVTASADKTVRVWNADGTGAPVVLHGHDALVWSATFGPDGERVVTASKDMTARVWNADGTGTPVVLHGHGDVVLSAAFNPNGRRVVTASKDMTARVWNADGTGTPVVLRGHAPSSWSAIRSAAFSPDGKRVVTAADDKTARVWNADGTGTPVVLDGLEGGVGSAAFSPDGKRVITVSGKTARLWNADGSGSPVVLEGHGQRVASAAFSPDGKRVVTASWDMTAQVWNVDGGGAPVVLERRDQRVVSAALSRDGTRVIGVSGDHSAWVWSADGTGTPAVLQGHTERIYRAAFGPDGQRVVTASGDKTARVWNADGTGTPIVLDNHRGEVVSAAFSPDGKRVVTASKDHDARVWESDGTGTPVALAGHTGPVISAAFSPDGRRVVTASYDKTARVWNADGTGASVVLRGHEHAVLSAAFSPDGQRVVTTAKDRTARVWRADGTGEAIVFVGHSGPVIEAAFSPDGGRLVTASWDKTARVWTADGTGNPIVLRGHSEPVISAAFGPHGERVVTTAQDSTGRIWDLDGHRLQRLLDRHLNGCLPVTLRVDQLGETTQTARAAVRACRKRKGLVPQPP